MIPAICPNCRYKVEVDAIAPPLNITCPECGYVFAFGRRHLARVKKRSF